MTMWRPLFACACGGAVPGGAACPACGARVGGAGGIFRCLSPARRAELEPFLVQYRFVRERDGYRTDRADYYRSLPFAPREHVQWPIWKIRQLSFDRLSRQVLSRMGPSPAVLDLGAGNGWLSYRLAKAGCRPVAVDLLIDDQDGLGACRHYEVLFPCVEADFDALPFAPRQFDVVIFNGSLHYAPDTRATLTHAAGMLRPGGALVVVDSPVFAREPDGVLMRVRNSARLRSEYGVAAPIEPGEGFLTLSRLESCAEALNLSAKFFISTRGPREAARRLAARVIRGYEPARFGVWTAS